jgi:glc operon protein GlcG
MNGREERATERYVRSIPSLTLEGAQAALESARSRAVELGAKVSIAVVDAAGNLLTFARTDGAMLVSIDAAISKARTAAQTRLPTRMLQELVDGGTPSLLAITQLTPAVGGVPVIHQGLTLGGVGGSGAALHEDEAVAQAGVDALLAALTETEAPQPQAIIGSDIGQGLRDG